MYIAHGPISYILNEKIQKKKISNFNRSQQFLVAIFSILFGILPDVDLLILRIVNIPPFLHHLLFSHSILLYISLWLLLNTLFWVLKNILNNKSRKVFTDQLLSVIQWSFLIGTISHFLADILFSHSRTLFPIQRQFTIFGDIIRQNYFSSYIFNPTFAVEILFVMIFSLMIYKRYIKKIKGVKVIIYSLITVTTLFFGLSLYMNLNIYNKANHFENKQMVMDRDFDSIHDSYDWDIDNDGVSNLLEADMIKLANFIEEISDGRYLVSSQATILNRAAYSFGAFTSYRVISQGYFEQGLSIESVLVKYARERDNIQRYMLDFSHPDTLYEYLSEHGDPTDLDTPGGIFFVFDNNGEVINLGLVVDNENLSVVLEDDTRLVLHSKEKVLDIYKDSTIKVLSIP